jgi:hypothetical protein
MKALSSISIDPPPPHWGGLATAGVPLLPGSSRESGATRSGLPQFGWFAWPVWSRSLFSFFRAAWVGLPPIPLHTTS